MSIQLVQSNIHSGTVELQRGQTYVVTSPLTIPSSTTIQATGTGVNPLVHYVGADWSSAFRIPHTSKSVAVKDIDFELGSKNPAYVINGYDVALFRNNIHKGYGLAQLTGVTGLYLEDCTALAMIDRNFIFAGTAENSHVTLRRVKVQHGSAYEHCVRFHATDTLLIDDCDLDNSMSPVHKQSLNLRDGLGMTINNSRFYGGSVIGPLADKDGGLYDPPSAERDAKLARRLHGAKFTNCVFHAYIILEAGLDGLSMDGCQHLLPSGTCIQPQAPYGPRPIPQGAIANASWTGSGKFIGGNAEHISLTNITHLG